MSIGFHVTLGLVGFRIYGPGFQVFGLGIWDLDLLSVEGFLRGALLTMIIANGDVINK